VTVTIKKKDEINEYTKKKKYKKKGKAKRRAYQCPPPFIMEYLLLKSNVDTPYMYIQLIGLKKCRILITVLTLRNRPSIVIKEGVGRIMAQLFILSYSDAR
jgi:hypothetical protein